MLWDCLLAFTVLAWSDLKKPLKICTNPLYLQEAIFKLSRLIKNIVDKMHPTFTIIYLNSQYANLKVNGQPQEKNKGNEKIFLHISSSLKWNLT